MINLNKDPSAVHNLKDGDHVLVDGVELVFTADKSFESDGGYLTTVDSKFDLYNEASAEAENGLEEGHDVRYPRYGDYIKHLRVKSSHRKFSDANGKALVSRSILVQVLVLKHYEIS